MPSKLNPMITSTLKASVGYNQIPASTLLIIPLTISDAPLSVILNQVGSNQDWSIRIWVSDAPEGQSLPQTPFTPGFWLMNRNAPQPLCLYPPGTQPTANSIAISVQPGSYYLNLLNLVNSENIFSLAMG